MSNCTNLIRSFCTVIVEVESISLKQNILLICANQFKSIHKKLTKLFDSDREPLVSFVIVLQAIAITVKLVVGVPLEAMPWVAKKLSTITLPMYFLAQHRHIVQWEKLLDKQQRGKY